MCGERAAGSPCGGCSCWPVLAGARRQAALLWRARLRCASSQVPGLRSTPSSPFPPLPCSHLHAEHKQQRQDKQRGLRPHRVALLVRAGACSEGCRKVCCARAACWQLHLTFTPTLPVCAAKPGRRTGASRAAAIDGRWMTTTPAPPASELSHRWVLASAAGGRPSRSCRLPAPLLPSVYYNAAPHAGKQGADVFWPAILHLPALLRSTHHRVWISWPCTEA